MIKTQALRSRFYSSAADIPEAKLNTELIWSPGYPSRASCEGAVAAVSALLGADVAIKASDATASVTYKSSVCMLSASP